MPAGHTRSMANETQHAAQRPSAAECRSQPASSCWAARLRSTAWVTARCDCPGRPSWDRPATTTRPIAVLRRAVELGVNHIDTSDYYGPHTVNQLIREALHPYPDDLVLVTKVGARRTPDGGWPAALSAAELTSAVHDNLRNLGVDRIDVVNLRMADSQRRRRSSTARWPSRSRCSPDCASRA